MAHCRQCRHCEDDPGAFERAVPGLNSLSSGYGESRGETAICHFHNMFFLPGPVCDDFAASSVPECEISPRSGAVR